MVLCFVNLLGHKRFLYAMLLYFGVISHSHTCFGNKKKLSSQLALLFACVGASFCLFMAQSSP